MLPGVAALFLHHVFGCAGCSDRDTSLRSFACQRIHQCHHRCNGRCARAAEVVPFGNPVWIVVGQPGLAAGVFPHQHFRRQVEAGGLLLLHQVGAALGRAEDDHFGRTQRHAHRRRIGRMIDAGENGLAVPVECGQQTACGLRRGEVARAGDDAVRVHGWCVHGPLRGSPSSATAIVCVFSARTASFSVRRGWNAGRCYGGRLRRLLTRPSTSGAGRKNRYICGMNTDAELLKRITIHPDRMHGRPCIRDLRMTVSDVLGLLAAGMSHAAILRDYPYLENADIDAALAFAARQADHPVIAAE